MNMNYDLIKYFYESGVFSVKEVANYVDIGELTEEEFHQITGYNFQGLKKTGNRL